MRQLSKVRAGALCAVAACAAACGALEPIVAPDGGFDASVFDGADVNTNDVTSDSPSDAGEAGPDVEASAPFTCGTKVCDSNTHYCEKKSADGGAPDSGKDGGVEVDTCVAYPTGCTDDGGKATCACILELCSCAQVGDQITVTCP